MRPLTLIGAIASTGWLLYEGFRSGRTIGCLAIFILLLAFKFGFSPLLAVSSIGLFLLHVVGLWLPLSACAIAAVTLYVDLRTDRLRRALTSPLA
jgi:hypothetical protein